MRTFAYCRVSTADQSPENQALEIAQAGFKVESHRIVADTVSGTAPAKQRPEFKQLLIKLEPGDVLVVTKLDRLGRSAMDVGATVHELAQGGVRVHCLALGGLDLTSPAGKMTMGVINAVAEFERDLLVERTNAGLDRARKAGTKLGRPSALTDSQRKTIVRRLAEGGTVYELAKEFMVSRKTIMRLRDYRAPRQTSYK